MIGDHMWMFWIGAAFGSSVSMSIFVFKFLKEMKLIIEKLNELNAARRSDDDDDPDFWKKA